MNSIIKNSFVPFLKKLWWVWLGVSGLIGTIWIIGPKSVGSFFDGAIQLIFTIFLLGAAYIYTLGRDNSGVWKLLRVTGLIGVFIFLIGFLVNEGSTIDIWDLAVTDELVVISRKFIFGTFASIVVFGFGELILYLHKINYKLRIAVETKAIKEMICPACYGKGFIDKNDLQRLNANEEIYPDVCGYCNANGYVERGRTEKDDLNFYIANDLPFIQQMKTYIDQNQGTKEEI